MALLVNPFVTHPITSASRVVTTSKVHRSGSLAKRSNADEAPCTYALELPPIAASPSSTSTGVAALLAGHRTQTKYAIWRKFHYLDISFTKFFSEEFSE
jgi:hypothetical protein